MLPSVHVNYVKFKLPWRFILSKKGKQRIFFLKLLLQLDVDQFILSQNVVDRPIMKLELCKSLVLHLDDPFCFQRSLDKIGYHNVSVDYFTKVLFGCS